MFFGISLGIVNLREPLAQVDAAPQMCRAPMRKRRIGLGKRDGGKEHEQREHWLHGRLVFLRVTVCPLGSRFFPPEGTEEHGAPRLFVRSESAASELAFWWRRIWRSPAPARGAAPAVLLPRWEPPCWARNTLQWQASHSSAGARNRQSFPVPRGPSRS